MTLTRNPKLLSIGDIKVILRELYKVFRGSKVKKPLALFRSSHPEIFR